MRCTMNATALVQAHRSGAFAGYAITSICISFRLGIQLDVLRNNECSSYQTAGPD